MPLLLSLFSFEGANLYAQPQLERAVGVDYGEVPPVPIPNAEVMLYPCEIVGVDYGEVPPVPIPNTEVKLISADDTWPETARENRSSPTQKQTVRVYALAVCFCSKRIQRTQVCYTNHASCLSHTRHRFHLRLPRTEGLPPAKLPN